MTFEALTSIAESKDIITFFDRLNSKKAFLFARINKRQLLSIPFKSKPNAKENEYTQRSSDTARQKPFTRSNTAQSLLNAVILPKPNTRRRRLPYILQVPFAELQEAIKKSSNDNEIAELLDVDIDTLHNAVECYQHKGLL